MQLFLMFNEIARKFLERKHIYYNTQYLYIGKYPHKMTIKGTTFTYEHYDIFLGNSTHLGCTTLYKRLTGNNPNSITEYNNPTYHNNLLGTKIFDSNNNIQYSIQKDLDKILGNNLPEEFSFQKLNKIINSINSKNMKTEYKNQLEINKRTKENNEKYKIKKEKIETMIEREFGKSK